MDYQKSLRLVLLGLIALGFLLVSYQVLSLQTRLKTNELMLRNVQQRQLNNESELKSAVLSLTPTTPILKVTKAIKK